MFANRRLHDNWQFLGSYTWSRLKGNYEGSYLGTIDLTNATIVSDNAVYAQRNPPQGFTG